MGQTGRMGLMGAKMKRTAILVAAGMVAAGAAWGLEAAKAVPRGIAYQGVLSDPVTGGLGGAQAVTFRVFRDPSGGDALWTKEVDVWCATGGVFQAWLDGEDDLIDAFSEPERFLEVQVEGHGDAIEPRVAFTSVPQALMARWARRAPLSFPVTGDLAVSNEVKVADQVQFGAGASFDSLSVAGNADWQDGGTAVEVSGNVAAARFEGDGLAPVGSIAMWLDAANIPSGWALCDGENGRPDLRDRFLVGVGGTEGYVYGQEGGADSVALTVEQMPSHTHGYTTASERDFHYAGAWHGSDWWQNSTSGHHKNGSTESTGSGEGHENRPPYYAVCFIIRVE